MNTNDINKKKSFDDEATVFPEGNSNANANANERVSGKRNSVPPQMPPVPPVQATSAKIKPVNKETAKKEAEKGGHGWKYAAAGVGGGIALGGAAAVAMSMAKHDTEHEGKFSDQKDDAPDWTDGKVGVATHVDDSMSFDEAFAAARAEVGPGGAFEWHGTVYGTYTAAEWNSMTAQERAEYNGHFSWSNAGGGNQQSSGSGHNMAATGNQESHPTDVAQNQVPGGQGGQGGDNVDPIRHSPGPNTDNREHPDNPDNPESEIEVIGVVHDPDDNTNVGVMTVDGHNAMVIDVDNDMKFDILAVDVNDDGNISREEMSDISDGNLTVADLGGFTPGHEPNAPEPAAEPDGNVVYAYEAESQRSSAPDPSYEEIDPSGADNYINPYNDPYGASGMNDPYSDYAGDNYEA